MSNRPEQIDRFFAVEGDIVQGVRTETKMGIHRRIVSKTVNRLLGGGPDITHAYRLYTRGVLEQCLPQMKSKGYAFMPEIMIRARGAGFKIVGVPVSYDKRGSGKSKRSYWANLGEYARLVAWRYWF